MAILYSSRIDAIHNVFGDINHTFAQQLQNFIGTLPNLFFH